MDEPSSWKVEMGSDQSSDITMPIDSQTEMPETKKVPQKNFQKMPKSGKSSNGQKAKKSRQVHDLEETASLP